MLAIQQELFDEHSDATRWARKPRFMLDKGHAQVIRLLRFADAFKYIEAQTPVAAHRIVIDIDRDVSAITRCNDWWQLLDVPTPSYVLLNAENGHAHVFYELEAAVATHDAARTAPLRYLAAIEAALRVALGGDVGYAGFICKNPHSKAWELHKGRRELYSLPELAEYLTLPRLEDLKREPSGFGRNCTLFDNLRQWSYRAVSAYRGGTVEAWSIAVYEQALGLNNFPQPLLESEIRATARSVSKWTWQKLGTGAAADVFSTTQKIRQKRGAAKKRAIKTADVVTAIAQLTSRGQRISKTAVAAIVGCSQQNLSKHYSDLFFSYKKQSTT